MTHHTIVASLSYDYYGIVGGEVEASHRTLYATGFHHVVMAYHDHLSQLGELIL